MVFDNSFISSAISLRARGVEGLLNNTAISKSISSFAEPFAWEPKRYTNSPNPKSTRRVGSEGGCLAYNITAGRKKSKRATTLYFSGQWLITKKGDKAKFKLSIPNTRKKTITFGIDKVLKEGKTLSAVLSTSGSRRRIRLTLRKKDWSVFVEGSKSKRSEGVKAGVKIRF